VTDSQDQPGRIVTFYSYKGGTGRTMALANVAWILASCGKRVLAVDWDLEAPGLNKFFRPFLDESVVAATPGVIEIINDYAWAAVSLESRPDDWHLEYADVMRHAVSLEWVFPESGTLDFLSAGRQNRDYSSAVSSLDWDNFYERLGGGRFFRAMRAGMKRNYDFVFIDSRTGLSDVADICTIELPDILVVCFTLNDQSIDGASGVARQISGRYRERDIRVLPVPMRVEDAEKEKLDVGRAVARTRFGGLPAKLSAEDAARYWASVEVPYKPFYAFEEMLATFGDDPGSPGSLLACFERLTSAITGEDLAMPPLREDLRLAYKKAFTRRAPILELDILVSYAPEDRMWADWIESVLEAGGFRVTRRPTTAEEPMTVPDEGRHRATQRVLVVLTGPYMASARAKQLWHEVSGSDPNGSRRLLVPVRVSDARLIPPFTDTNLLDLSRLNAEQAATALLRACDRRAPAVTAPEPDREMRFPGTVPSIWSVPPRNAYFTGRAAVLEQVRDAMTGAGMTVVLAQALYGLGGVGKTQIALEYAYRFKADYDLVWWIAAERVDAITSSLADLAIRLGLRAGDNLTETALAGLEVLRRDSTGRWLLIFDNAEDPKSLESYLPTGNGHIIVTSRNQAWSRAAAPLEVDVFTREESIAHLVRHVPELAPEDADRVANALGDLPLAVEQAGAWLYQTGMPAPVYVEQLENQVAATLALSQPASYPISAVATWNLSFERLRERSPAAVRLLQVCAFCAPGTISMTLLYGDEMIAALLPYDQSLTEKMLLGRVIREISRFALMKVDQGANSLQIHRLVQAVIRSQMTDAEQDEARHEVHKILVGARPRRGDSDDPENWSRYDLIWPHLEPSDAKTCRVSETRQLLIDWVRYLWKNGEFDSALVIGLRLLDGWTQSSGPDDPQVLHLQYQIAHVLRSQGRFGEARELDNYVLDRQRAVLTPDHPQTLLTASGLATDLRAMGDFRLALRSDQDTYDRFRELFGEDHPSTLAVANNLAVTYRLVGDFLTARQVDDDTLARRRAVLGTEHPDTLFSAAAVAYDLREGGALQESVELYRTAYEAYCGVLGEDHVESLRAGQGLAISLRKLGHAIEAEGLAEDIYERCARNYGRDSADSRSFGLTLACCRASLDDLPHARDLTAEILEACRRHLGDEHPTTLLAASNLAAYLRGVGDVSEARALAERTHAEMAQKLGDDHPSALCCAINLANCQADLGQTGGAIALQRRTFEMLKAKLGPRHPDTLACAANLAVTLREAGQMDEAEQLRDRTLEELGGTLGESHSAAISLREWRRVDRELEPQPI
jgi:MinD-like ATPase involved in chromosome partitioning or flagellar assembly/tetratricopeptide (TPR) repeat protein